MDAEENQGGGYETQTANRDNAVKIFFSCQPADQGSQPGSSPGRIGPFISQSGSVQGVTISEFCVRFARNLFMLFRRQ